MTVIAGQADPRFPNLRPTALRATLPALLNRTYDTAFSVFLFITVFFPSGTLYGFNLKLPLYAILFPLAVYRLLRDRVKAGDLILLISVPSLLAVWVVIGLSHGFDPAGVFRQFTDIFLTIFLCWFANFFSEGDEDRSFRLVRLILTAEVMTSLMKVSLIAYALIRGIPVVQVVTALSAAFGVNLMTMDLGALFGRVQFVSDALIPVCIYSVLRHRDRLEYGAWRASVTILLLFVSVLFSFSRYLWIFSVVSLLLGLLLGKKDRFQLALTVVLILAVIASLPVLGAMYELRFSTQVAGASDSERVAQSRALQEFFLDNPFLGHGLGSFTQQVTRENDSEASRYSYEMQLLALAGQVGLVGLSLLAALVLWYYRKLWSRGSMSLTDRAGITILLLCWFSVGLYNPLLLNPVAGVSYITFAALADLRSDAESRSLYRRYEWRIVR